MISGSEMEFHVQGLTESPEKDETNSVPRLEVTCDGTPCLEKTWSTNNLESNQVLIVSTVGMKMDCLVSRSTMTRMVLKPEEDGSFSMKSIEIKFQGCSGIGSCLRSL